MDKQQKRRLSLVDSASGLNLKKSLTINIINEEKVDSLHDLTFKVK